MSSRSLNIHIVMVALLLVACGKEAYDDLIHEEHAPGEIRVTNYIFKSYLKRLPIKSITPIIFKVRPIGIAGTCSIWSNGYREISIDPNYWVNATDAARLEILAHEIGHCDYNLDHNNEVVIDKELGECPASVMNDTNFSDPCFTKYFNSYMKEFV